MAPHAAVCTVSTPAWLRMEHTTEWQPPACRTATADGQPLLTSGGRRLRPAQLAEAQFALAEQKAGRAAGSGGEPAAETTGGGGGGGFDESDDDDEEEMRLLLRAAADVRAAAEAHQDARCGAAHNMDYSPTRWP